MKLAHAIEASKDKGKSKLVQNFDKFSLVDEMDKNNPQSSPSTRENFYFM